MVPKSKKLSSMTIVALAISPLLLLFQNCTGFSSNHGASSAASTSGSASGAGSGSSSAPATIPASSTTVSYASEANFMATLLTFPTGGLTLNPGQSVPLYNGESLIFTSTADLQVVNASGSVLWDTKTSATCSSTMACLATFQTDGNLVIYNSTQAIWSSATYNNNEGYMVVTSNQPYLSVFNNLGTLLWSSGGSGLAGVQAQSANDFLSSLGVNIHISQGINYQAYETPLRYLGVRNVRDYGTPVASFVALHQATNVLVNVISDFDVNGIVSLGHTLNAAGALLSIEGPNEPNNFPGTYNGQTAGGAGSWVPLAQFQTDMYTALKADSTLNSLPVFSISEDGAETDNVGLQFLTIPTGAGTTFSAGTAFADFVNPHNYVSSTQNIYVDNMAWQAANPTLNSYWDALFAEFGITWRGHYQGYSTQQLVTLPRVTTETGWDSVSNPGGEPTQGAVLVNTYLAQFKQGWKYTFIYELADGEGGPGAQGLFHSDYSPKAAATNIHNLTTILNDTQSMSNPGTLAYSISNQTPTVHDLLLQKSNGTFELVIWDERSTTTTDSVVVNLATPASQINEYDVTVGTTPIQTLTNVTSVPLTLNNHPVILEF